MNDQERKYTLISLFSGYDTQALALRGIGRLIAYAVTSLVTSDSWQHGSLQHRVRTFALSRRSKSLPVARCRRRRRATWDDIVDRGDLGFPALDIAMRKNARRPKSLGTSWMEVDV